MEKNQVPVLIAGAGPTGLVLALWLKKKGVAFRIIDKSSAPGETSRAIAVQTRTLEYYRQLGVADALISAGITVQELILRRFGHVVAHARFGPIGRHLSPFSYLLFCSQDVHEALLCAELKKFGVEVERQTELLGFQQSDDGVTARLKTPRGEETVSAAYLCGCDGAHSTVRHGIASEFPGGTYSQIFFVADVLATGPMAEGGVQISVSMGDFCIVMPIQTKGTVRLIGIVPPESEGKEVITFNDVESSVLRSTGLKIEKVNWFASYRVHHRVAPHFRKGRVFLAGDAGHIHSPAGGQGMNTGIGDAVNLAWKLADVIQGRFSAKLLDSYESERMAFARVLVKTTDTAFKVIASRSYIGSLFRTFVLPRVFAFITKFQFTLKIMFRTISQTRIHYRESFVSAGKAGRIQAGDRLPWVKFDSSDNYEALKSMVWQAHVYGELSGGITSENLALPLHQFEWNADAKAKGFRRDALYVIRPDGHVGLAVANPSASVVKDYFEKINLRSSHE